MNKKLNSILSAGTKDDSSTTVQDTPVRQHRSKPIVKRRIVCEVRDCFDRCRKTAVGEMSIMTHADLKISVQANMCQVHIDKFNPFVGNYLVRHLNYRKPKYGV